jgi:prepilin-type N-terminal cleavage/methylation domain-containing protein
MKKNGFTLVELIISIALLSLIGISIGITLNSTFKRNSDNEYKTFVNKISSSANVFASSDSTLTSQLESNKGYIIITLKDLINAGILDEKLVNPNTGEQISADEKVKIVLDDSGAIKIVYPVESEEEYLQARAINYKYDKNNPTQGIDDVCFKDLNTVNLGLIDDKGNLVANYFTKNDNITCTGASNIDYKKMGIYELTYSYKNTEGVWKTATRKVNVVDGERPTIENVTYTPVPPTWSKNGATITATLKDNDSLNGYCINKGTISTDDCTCSTYLSKDSSGASIVGKKQANISISKIDSNDIGNGHFYICVKDISSNSAHSSDINITNIDLNAPIVTDTTSYPSDYVTSMVLTYKFDDSESGLNSYYISTTNSKPTASSSSWIGINNISGCSLGSKTCNFTYNNIPKNTTYYIWVKDQVGNISNVVTSNVNKLKKKLTMTLSKEGLSNSYINENNQANGLISIDSLNDTYNGSLKATVSGNYINLNGTASSYVYTYSDTCKDPANSYGASYTTPSCNSGGTYWASDGLCHNVDKFVDHSGCSCSFSAGVGANKILTASSCNPSYTNCGSQYLQDSGCDYYLDTSSGRLNSDANARTDLDKFCNDKILPRINEDNDAYTFSNIHATATCTWIEYSASGGGYSCPTGGTLDGYYCYSCAKGTLNSTNCEYTCQRTVTLYHYNVTINYWVRND